MVDLELIFRKILKPALGCTEPVAVALAVSAATQATAGWTPETDTLPLTRIELEDIKDVQVIVSRNIFKNSFSIIIPNAEGHKGILMASALGLFCDPRKELGVFSNLDRSWIQAAQQLISRQVVHVEVAKEIKADLYIKAIVTLNTPEGPISSECIIIEDHSNILSLRRGSEVIFSRQSEATNGPAQDKDLAELKEMTIADLVALTENLPESVLALIRQTIEMNTKACESGLSQPLGLGTGFYGVGSEDFQNASTLQIATNMSAAGSDARMSGFPVEVMSSAGSGNQGIIATIPVVVYARRQGVDEAVTLRAVALSHLITMYVTLYIGYLSALCGVAIKAGIGAACGIVYAMGGGADDIAQAVKVMAASLTGMICDGAKAGCALKVGTAADMAFRAASLAMRKIEVPDDNGIVAQTAEETIRNLALLSFSMDVVDEKILDIMKEKLIAAPQTS